MPIQALIEKYPLLSVLGLPSSFVNVYGASSPWYSYRETATGAFVFDTFDLGDLFTNSWIPLIQTQDFTHDSSFPRDIALQSIVHVRVGVLPRDQQARVTFYFRTPPNTPNKVQIFISDARGQRLDKTFDTPQSSDWWTGDRSVLVYGDGVTSIDVHFRPALQGMGFFNPLFYERAEVVGI